MKGKLKGGKVHIKAPNILFPMGPIFSKIGASETRSRTPEQLVKMNFQMLWKYRPVMSDKTQTSELHSLVVNICSSLLHLAPKSRDLNQAVKKIMVVKDEQTQKG